MELKTEGRSELCFLLPVLPRRGPLLGRREGPPLQLGLEVPREVSLQAVVTGRRGHHLRIQKGAFGG